MLTEEQRYFEVLKQLREIKHDLDAVPKRRDLYLIAYVALGAVVLFNLVR